MWKPETAGSIETFPTPRFNLGYKQHALPQEDPLQAQTQEEQSNGPPIKLGWTHMTDISSTAYCLEPTLYRYNKTSYLEESYLLVYKAVQSCESQMTCWRNT
jgi:hypothetical protein